MNFKWKMKTIVLSVILFVSVQNSFSVDTNSAKYFPLRVGNSWTYYYESSVIPYYRYRYRITVQDSFLINSNIYFKVFTERPYSGNITETLRVNQNNGNLLKYSVSFQCPWMQNETLVDSIASRLHDSAKSGICSLYFKCIDTANHSIFGIIKPHKAFAYTAFENYQIREYAKDFGSVYKGSWGGVGGSYSALIGCVINGILYGDTNLVNITHNSSEVPNAFSLSQNYPNPFNPVTKIKFDIPPLSFGEGKRTYGAGVRLIIYDILGREITTLVNEQLQPGTYEVEWDGTNYPSGVYFYKLAANDYSETKKMVLVK